MLHNNPILNKQGIPVNTLNKRGIPVKGLARGIKQILIISQIIIQKSKINEW